MARAYLGDLGKVIKRLEGMGRLTRIHSEVDPVHELAALAARMAGRDAAILFENVKGHKAPVLCGLYSSKPLLMDLLGSKGETPDRFIAARVAQWQQHPVAPLVKKTGPVKQVTQNKPDVTRLPVPTHALADGGAYFDAAVVLARDPETGVRNASIHRTQVIDATTLALLIDPGRHLGDYLEKARNLGQPLPITINIGVGPSVYFAAATPSGAAPLDSDELGVASAFQESPLELVKGNMSDVELIGRAMYAMECDLLPGETEMEGPFAEVTGLYALPARRPRVKIKAIHHRRKPIFHTQLSGTGGFSMVGMMGGAQMMELLPKQVPGILDVHMTPGASGLMHAVIQMTPTQSGWPKNAIMAAFGQFSSLKMVTVVDEDVDIRDPDDVEWAMANRLIPSTGIHLVQASQGLGLNPSFPDGIGTKIGFDCTRAFPHEEKDDRVTFQEVSLADYKIEYAAKH
ncbi:MAG: UbiD family decarboxylase, partial [Rhodospirillales bacterium]|nr:UbiD family decarboxylase [Rhodospirillales bacterium]